MKKTLLYIAIFLGTVFAASSCEDYLDKSPDLGLDESEIYKNYESIRGFLDEAYDHLYEWMYWHEGHHGQTAYMVPLTHTDEMASTRTSGNFMANYFNLGDWYYATNTSQSRRYKWEIGIVSYTLDGILYTPISVHCYRALRIVNRVIANIDQVKEITDEQKNWILGQAYFYRAWYYFELIKRWGGMPKLDRVFNGGDDNIPRMTYRESSEWMRSDLEKAIEMLPDAWPDDEWCKPDKVAAMAVKAEALLYEASPLFQNGLDATVKQEYDKALCREAARAAKEVLDYIEAHPEARRGFQSAGNGTDMDKYKNIFYLDTRSDFHHPEYLWWVRHKQTVAAQDRDARFMKLMELSSQTGAVAQQTPSPTYTITKYFERKGPDGNYYPVSDPKSGYVEGEWSSFQNRDPRLYNAVLLPGERWGSRQGVPYYISTWRGGSGYTLNTSNTNNNRGFSGFLVKKYLWWETGSYWKSTSSDQTGSDLHSLKTFYIRVSEMYLNFAEAVFEATGDPFNSEFGMSPVEALNIIRRRVGVTDIQAPYNDASHFRDTYRRERTVELVFEDHRWIDVRRWMIFDEVFPTETPLEGVVWEIDQTLSSTAVSAQNSEIYALYHGDPGEEDDTKQLGRSKLTFHYTVIPMSAEVRAYRTSDNRCYLYPFQGNELASLSNLKQNPGW
ncbi:MAG: RagB/SusD family nutrient uptake outer membrane protein [Bacteroidales bacterium]|nr:RagB/SusD family nutrient uptake outer membrane protein [Bacteroidales bacterium]